MEDTGRCLLGLFDASLPMPYGEAGKRVFHRFRGDIISDLSDQSIGFEAKSRESQAFVSYGAFLLYFNPHLSVFGRLPWIQLPPTGISVEGTTTTTTTTAAKGVAYVGLVVPAPFLWSREIVGQFNFIIRSTRADDSTLVPSHDG